MQAKNRIRRHAGVPGAHISLRQTFGLMDEVLQFETNDERLLRAADEAFGRFAIPASHAPPLTVRLFTHQVGGALQSRARHQPTFHIEKHLFTITLGEGNLAAADLRTGFAFGYLTPEVVADTDFVRYTFVEGLALAMLGLGRGYVGVHAACVVKDGLSVILQAVSGTGKSTLAYACLRRGWQLLAEDVVFFRAAPRLQLWGMPWKLRLMPDAARLFPELGGLTPRLQPNGEAKLELDVEALYPAGTLTHAAPGPVVLLARGLEGAGVLEKLPPPDALDGFEVLWHWREGWTDEMEQAALGLLGCGVYRLVMNGSPDEAVEALERMKAEG